MAEQFTFQISNEDEDTFVKGLVSGHRGNGKTSELYRLKAQLESEGYFVIYFDIEKELGLDDVKGIEIITLIAEQISSTLHALGLSIDPTILSSIYEYFSTKTLSEVSATAADLNVEASVEVGAKLPFIASLLAKLKSTFKFSSERKVEIRKDISLDFSSFSSRLNRLIKEATTVIRRELHRRGLVAIVDGLEKLAYSVDGAGISNYVEIFERNADQLLAPQCHVIYTVPISLAYGSQLDSFAGWPYVMPMLNLNKARSFPLIREVLSRRIDFSMVFEDLQDVDRIIAMSGGCMRDLMFLLRSSCGPGDKVKPNQVARAFVSFQQGYDRLLAETDIPILAEVMDSHTIDGASTAGVLLDRRVVLEYQNDRRWVALHPAIEKSESFQLRLSRFRRKQQADPLSPIQATK